MILGLSGQDLRPGSNAGGGRLTPLTKVIWRTNRNGAINNCKVNGLNSECPTDISNLAESYHLGRLSLEQAATLEEHYIGCSDCAAAVERAAAYIAAIRAAAREILAKDRPVTLIGRSS